MKNAVRRAVAVAAAVAFLAPRDGAAMGVVVGSTSDPVAIASARIAVASSPGRTVRWAQIEVTSTKSGFAWLLPLLPGARVDLASDAWLDALDAATVPVVKPPKASPECAVAREPEVLAAATSSSSRSPLGGLVALDALSLATYLSGSGFETSGSLATALGDVFSSGGAVLALTYGAGALPVHTVRVLDDGPATLPFSLAGSLGLDVPVTAFAIAGGARQAGSSSLTVDPDSLRWLGNGTSSYEAGVASLLAGAGGARWLTQSSEPGGFFQQTTIDSTLSLPATLDQYYLLASAYGDSGGDSTSCAAAADATSGGSVRYAAACPAGALAIVSGASPCGSSPPDATPITDLVCGAAVDAALAVGNLLPGGVWVTRIEGIVTASSAADVPLVHAGATHEPRILRAGSYGADCGSGDAGASGESDFPEGGGWGYDVGSAGEGGSWGDPWSSFGGGDGGALQSLGDLSTVASDGCDGTSTTSSSEDDTSSGCSGDTSSTDSGSDSGCDASSSSSSDSGGCSGGESSSTSDCSTAKRGARSRSPLSRLVLVASAVLGLARRLRRRPSRSG